MDSRSQLPQLVVATSTDRSDVSQQQQLAVNDDAEVTGGVRDSETWQQNTHMGDVKLGKLLTRTCSEISCNVKWNVYLAMEIPDCVSFISGQNSDDRVRSCEPNVFLA